MKFYIFVILVLLGFSISTFTHAGHERGNGGYVEFCKINGSYTAQLLDFVEGQYLGYKFDFGPNTRNYSDVLALFLNRLKRLDPIRARLYTARADEFMKFFKVSSFIDRPLGDPQDAIPIVKEKKGCKYRVAALRLNKSLDSKYKYLVDDLAWGALHYSENGEAHTAGLILHEVIYGEAFDSGRKVHKTSMYSRKFVRWIASDQFEMVSKEDYDKFIIDNEFDFNENKP